MKEQEEKRLMSCCDRCVFWDYTKSRCREWYELKIPNDSLHECSMFADMGCEEQMGEAKQVLMITIPYDNFEYYENNKWKIRTYDALLFALERNHTSLVVDSEGKMEIVTSSDNWGIHWTGVER